MCQTLSLSAALSSRNVYLDQEGFRCSFVQEEKHVGANVGTLRSRQKARHVTALQMSEGFPSEDY